MLHLLGKHSIEVDFEVCGIFIHEDILHSLFIEGDSMKKTSIRQLYWFTMICHIFALLCGIGGSIIMVVNYKEFIENFGKILGIIFLIGIVGLFAV